MLVRPQSGAPLSDPARDRWLARLPDDALHVEVRGLLCDRDSDGFLHESGFALRHRGLAIAVAHGSIPVDELTLCAEWSGEAAWVAVERDALLRVVPAARIERAIVHALSEGAFRPGEDVANSVRWLVREDLADVPAEMRAEQLAALERGPVAASFDRGAAVAFAYAVVRTERWFSLSVDTLPAWRRRGHARIAAAALIAAECRAGRRPSWGALASNEASLGLARTLGFAEVGSIWVAEPN